MKKDPAYGWVLFLSAKPSAFRKRVPEMIYGILQMKAITLLMNTKSLKGE